MNDAVNVILTKNAPDFLSITYVYLLKNVVSRGFNIGEIFEVAGIRQKI